MSLETRDAEIARIFARLKVSETGYPPRLFDARRTEFKKRVSKTCLELECSIAFINLLKSKGSDNANHAC
ncbi:MAG TPA: hypothetical protein PKK96_11915 [Anaerolineales bacterium]|nr:hypothetical protein [Anaerolineales bacterium]HMS01128.1 hypothetical protein [Anaerolineales bacterium]HNQ94967.1 hypothetical protein [Anaerolineales bacterium]HNS61704.1 hypothetical protein [Anaerolineales bacterium]